MVTTAKKSRRNKSAAPDLVTRVICLPVVKPISVMLDGEPAPLSWTDFARAADQAWREASDLSNMIYRKYALADLAPMGPDGKLVKFNPDGKPIYAAARELFPQFDTNTLASLMQTARRSYMADRFEMYVLRSRSLRSFTAGRIALPIKAGSWVVSERTTESGRDLLLSLRLGSKLAPGIRARRITVMLGTGRKHARHAAVLRRVIAGEIEAADLKLKQRTLPDGNRQILAAITVRMPPAEKKSGGDLLLRTGADSLLIWRFNDDDDRPPLHFDNLRQLLAGRDAQQQRWSDDLKFEKRWPARKRRRMLRRRRRRNDRWANAIDTAIGQIVAMIRGVAVRNRISRVIYDDSERGFAPKFPWYHLKKKLADSMTMEGIEFVGVKASAPAASAEPKDDPGVDGSKDRDVQSSKRGASARNLA